MKRNTLFLVAAFTLALMTGTANAGEPFHPFWDPIYDGAIAIYNFLFQF